MEKINKRKKLAGALNDDVVYHLIAPAEKYGNLEAFFSGVWNVSHFVNGSDKYDFRLNHGFLSNILAYGCDTEKVDELESIVGSSVSAEEKAKQIAKLRPMNKKNVLEIGGSDSIFLNPDFTAEIFENIRNGNINCRDGLQDALTYAV